MRGDGLTVMEAAIVRGLWDGQSQKELAGALGLSLPQMNYCVRAAKQRLGSPTTIALLRDCLRKGVLEP